MTINFSSGDTNRRPTRGFKLGHVPIGAGAPISIQSMTNTDTRDVDATLGQIKELASVGCDIVRVAVPDQAAVAALPGILAGSRLPVVADIHFDYRLAIASLQAGVHCLRINPGTIGKPAHLALIAECAVAHGVPLRIGINSGSLEDDLLERHGGPTPEALVESAMRHCTFFEEHGCHNLKVSLKTSRVTTTVAACRMFAAQTDYPLHLGVTEAGTFLAGSIKSAVALGTLLLEGIGDTLRVSLTAPPAEEVRIACQILEATGHRQARPEIVSCPTCGRTEIEIFPMAEAVEKEVRRLKAEGYVINLDKIAVMGCIVNGPGEARDADLGIAGGKGKGALFKHGKVIASLPEKELLEALLKEIRAAATKPPCPTNAGDGNGGVTTSS